MPTMTTGGPNPPIPVQTTTPPVTPGGYTAPTVPGSTYTPTNTMAGLPSSSPIPIMDWAAKLKAGDEAAKTRNVGAQETVQSQLNDITAGGSKYIQQARQGAATAASNRGMMMSTMAAGSGERAAIEAAMPIAQQDAQTYGRTASENMSAENQDRLADQQMYGNLTGQEVGIRANLAEAERSRAYGANENAANRQATAAEAAAARQHQSTMAAFDASFQSAQNALNRQFQGSESDKAAAAQRLSAYYNLINGQQGMLAQTLAAIYQNPNLSASQQAAAAANAQTTFKSLFESYAQTMAAGIPPIFYNPYPMTFPTTP